MIRYSHVHLICRMKMIDLFTQFATRGGKKYHVHHHLKVNDILSFFKDGELRSVPEIKLDCQCFVRHLSANSATTLTLKQPPLRLTTIYMGTLICFASSVSEAFYANRSTVG